MAGRKTHFIELKLTSSACSLQLLYCLQSLRACNVTYYTPSRLLPVLRLCSIKPPLPCCHNLKYSVSHRHIIGSFFLPKYRWIIDNRHPSFCHSARSVRYVACSTAIIIGATPSFIHVTDDHKHHLSCRLAALQALPLQHQQPVKIGLL